MNAKGPVMVYTGGGQRATTGEAHLWVCSGKNIGRRFALDKPDMVIGRSSGADIPVVDERVSQQHALVEPKGSGHALRDLGSTNGTFVNNQRVHEADLRDGDLIQVGETVFEYLSYQERNLTITLRGTNRESDSVPADLRNEARQMLEQARVEPHSGPIETAPNMPVDTASPPLDTMPPTGPTMDITAQDPAATGASPPSHIAPIQRPARDIGYSGPPGYPMPGLPVPYQQPHYPMVPTAVPAGIAPLEERAGVVVEEGEDQGFSLDFVLARLKFAQDIFSPYWKSMVFLLAAGIGLGLFMFQKSPPSQTAQFEITLRAGTSSNPLQPYFGRLRGFFAGAELAFKSDKLIEKTLAELGQDNATPAVLNATKGSLTLKSAGPPTPDTYTGQFVHKDGDWALSFLETHVRLYLESEVEKALKVLKAEGTFLEEQVEDMEKQLRRTEAELMEFKKANLDATGNSDAYTRLLTLRVQESEAIMNVNKARKTRRMLQGRLRNEQPMIKTKATFDNHYKVAIAKLELQLIQAKSDGQGPDHPDVIKMERRLEELKVKAQEAKENPTSVETSRNPVHTRIQNEERNLQIQEQIALQQLAFVRDQIKKTEGVVTRLPELEAEKADLMRSYKTTKDQYDKLLQKLQIVQVQLNLERASAAARYDVISEPHLLYQPRGKKMAMYAILGAVLGLMLGVMLAAARWAIATGKLAPIIAMFRKPAVATSDSTALAPLDAPPSDVALQDGPPPPTASG